MKAVFTDGNYFKGLSQMADDYFVGQPEFVKFFWVAFTYQSSGKGMNIVFDGDYPEEEGRWLTRKRQRSNQIPSPDIVSQTHIDRVYRRGLQAALICDFSSCYLRPLAMARVNWFLDFAAGKREDSPDMDLLSLQKKGGEELIFGGSESFLPPVSSDKCFIDFDYFPKLNEHMEHVCAVPTSYFSVEETPIEFPMSIPFSPIAKLIFILCEKGVLDKLLVKKLLLNDYFYRSFQKEEPEGGGESFFVVSPHRKAQQEISLCRQTCYIRDLKFPMGVLKGEEGFGYPAITGALASVFNIAFEYYDKHNLPFARFR